MDTIHETGAVMPEMPRFDDGMADISELLRILAQSLVNAPAPAYDGSAAEHAAMIMALAMADNPVPGRKAAWHVVGWLRFLAIARFARPASRTECYTTFRDTTGERRPRRKRAFWRLSPR